MTVSLVTLEVEILKDAIEGARCRAPSWPAGSDQSAPSGPLYQSRRRLAAAYGSAGSLMAGPATATGA